MRVEVEDLNDNAPVFNPGEYAASISGHAQPGTEILNVVASDRDSGRFGRVTYHVLPGDVSGLFSLDATTGREEKQTNKEHVWFARCWVAVRKFKARVKINARIHFYFYIFYLSVQNVRGKTHNKR